MGEDMESRRFSSHGIVLARKNYGEADRILTIYSKHYGKLVFLAKGVRKPKSRKRGHIEVFNNVFFSASRGPSIPIITEAEVINTFDLIRRDLKRVSVAYYLLEVVKRLTEEAEKNEKLYDLTLRYLTSLCTTETNLKMFRHKFVKECLSLLGFWPIDKELENPDKTLEEITERKLVSFRVGKKLLQ